MCDINSSMYNSQVLVSTPQQNWWPYGSALGSKPIQFISLRLKRQCAHCPMEKKKKKRQVFKFRPDKTMLRQEN